ncbi:MAG: hypothetical protein QW056_03460 [Candidatus Bathyarchaeia archaeon]
MRSWIKKALTMTVHRKGPRGEQETIIIQPSERLVYAVYFSLGMVTCLTILEALHLAFLGEWNTEIFNIISLLVGNITGIFLTQKT